MRSASSRLRQPLIIGQSEGDVAADRRGERRRLLEHHADQAAQVRQWIAAIEDVAPSISDFAGRALIRIKLVDAVDRAQQGRFAAARRADDRGDGVRRDRHGDVLQRVALAVIEVEIADLDLVVPETGAVAAGAIDMIAGAIIVHLCLPLRASSRTSRLRTSTNAVSTKAPAQASACHSSYGLIAYWKITTGTLASGCVEVRAPELVVQRGEQQRRGFSGDARDAEQDSGEDRAHRRLVEDLRW